MNNDWFKPKKYIHLTDQLTYDDFAYVNSIVKSSTAVSKHSFCPLIHRVKKQRRYKKNYNAENNIVRSHYNSLEKKSNTKPRQIFYATHIDSMIYAYYAKGEGMLGDLYKLRLEDDPKLNESIIAYRKIEQKGSKKGKSNIDFTNDVIEIIRKREESVVICLDISKFFDSLDHKILKKSWANLLGG